MRSVMALLLFASLGRAQSVSPTLEAIEGTANASGLADRRGYGDDGTGKVVSLGVSAGPLNGLTSSDGEGSAGRLRVTVSNSAGPAIPTSAGMVRVSVVDRAPGIEGRDGSAPAPEGHPWLAVAVMFAAAMGLVAELVRKRGSTSAPGSRNDPRNTESAP